MLVFGSVESKNIVYFRSIKTRTLLTACPESAEHNIRKLPVSGKSREMPLLHP
jgi:hypothetical protein